ncbi:MAG TPA: extracellular solute-binding protein [Candidatus Binatia bacterium]|jgi:iron(III) transport system substrate-binding protein|nr:extracellular solute-binding protein [Candidatus Binatia bacterium]
MKLTLHSLIGMITVCLLAVGERSFAQEWDKVLAAAKKEGKVAVIGPVGADRRDVLVEPFQKKYGITVEYFADRGSGIGPRLSAERAAGQYLWDVAITGTTTGLLVLLPPGMLDPLEPALLLPDVKDPRNWRGGALEFSDAGKRFLVMTPSQRGTLFVNPKVTKPQEIKSYKDLLNPKWRKKIVMDDPTRAGPGQATFTFFYLHPELGPNFIRALAKQEPAILRDYTQEIDGIAREKYSVLIGVSDIVAEERMKDGLPIAILDPRQIKEGSDISPGSGGLGFFNRAPHQNAAKVYINWLLSKEGQEGFAKVNGYISARLDVPTDHSPWRVPIPGSIKTYTQQAIDIKDDLTALFKEAFGR